MTALPRDLTRLTPDQLQRFLDGANKTLAERHLYDFVQQGWSSVDSHQFLDAWAIEALCVHLEAVTRGEIKRLLVNFPPRCGKTIVTSACWPLWTWLQKNRSITSGPGVSFLCASYGADLSLKNAELMRSLMNSPWFQANWGDKIKIRASEDTKAAFANLDGGRRESTSITGRLIGFGGSVILVDDPHNTEDVESEAEREHVLRGWRELSTTRLNDPKKSPIVVIMQRLHEEDVSGQIIKSDDYDNWCHLMLPMRHDVSRHCVTYLDPTQDEPAPEQFWEDPREDEDELLWPERFGDKEIDNIIIGLGPYMASGRLQQAPSPSGGGIIHRDWWDEYAQKDTNGRYVFPVCEFVLASLDPAYTEKQENDFSALTVWGVWNDNGVRKLILLYAWQKRLPIIGTRFDKSQVPNWTSLPETQRRDIEQQYWGLTEWVADACSRFRVDRLLIESKASGISVSQAIRKLYQNESFGAQLVDPKGKDKVARLHATVPLFADGLVYRPPYTFRWVDMVVSNIEMFPKAAHDDLVDSTSQALMFFRNNGLLQLSSERDFAENELRQYRSKPKPLYPGSR